MKHLRVDLLPRRVRAHTEDTVLTLEPDLDRGVEVLGDESGDTNTKVNVEAVVDLPSGAASDAMSPVLGCNSSSDSGIRVCALLFSVLGESENLDFLRSGGLHDAIDIDTRDVNSVRRKAADRTARGVSISVDALGASTVTYTISSASTMVNFALRAMTPL